MQFWPSQVSVTSVVPGDNRLRAILPSCFAPGLTTKKNPDEEAERRERGGAGG